MQKVKLFRQGSLQKAANAASDTPALFVSIRQPVSDYLLIPIVSSERRDYIPIGYMQHDVIYVEEDFEAATIIELEKMGYQIKKRGAIGRTELILMKGNKIIAVADKRGDDAAEGY